MLPKSAKIVPILDTLRPKRDKKGISKTNNFDKRRQWGQKYQNVAKGEANNTRINSLKHTQF